MADITGASPALAGRDRVRVESESGAGYRTFPSRLPAILTVLGGGLIVLGSFGAALRASAITSLREDPHPVRVLSGYHEGIGWVMAGLGLALVALSFAWLGRRLVLKAAVVAVTIVTGAVVAGRLQELNNLAAAWADAVVRRPHFVGFHAGLGWGAWCVLVGAILTGFGALVGVLRELDLRKGLKA